MPNTIISAVSQVLTPDLVAKMASASGISVRTMAQKAVAAAVPAILSSLANLASKPEGAQQLAGAIGKQSPDVVEKLASSIGGFGQLADTGKTILSSLLGGSSFGSLAGTIGRFAGVGQGMTGSLLGMLTPVILGVLGREAGAGVSGLTQLLASQKENIAAAMPAGLSDLLQASGFNEGMASVAPAAGRVNETYRAPRDTAGGMVHAVSPSRAAPSSNWMYWALPVLALAGLAWYFLRSDDRSSRPVAVVPQPTTTMPVQGSIAGGDLGRQVTAVVDSLNTLLPGLKDQASLNDALPRLQQAATELDQLKGLANRLTIEARDKLAEATKAATARLKSGLDNINSMSDLAPNVKPVVAALRSNLDALAMTPGSVAQQRIGAFLARAQNDTVLISTYFDRSVYNGAGETIGTITDLVVGPDDKIVAAVIGVGGFLGIGEKEVAVPFSSMQVQRRDNDLRLVMNTTKAALEAAPQYEESGLRVRLSPAPAQK